MSNDSEVRKSSKRRLRFSLLNLFMLTTIAAMALVIWQLAPLREEVRRLRNGAGELTIDDKNQVHAIGIETYHEFAWKWKLWVPAGQTIKLKTAVRDIRTDRAAFPKSARDVKIDAGAEGREVVFSLGAQMQLDGNLRWMVKYDGTTRYISQPEEAADWLLKGSIGWSSSGVEFATEDQQPGRPLVLLKRNYFYDDSGQTPPPNPPETTDGIMLWIEAVGNGENE